MFALLAAFCIAAIPGCGKNEESKVSIPAVTPTDHLSIARDSIACIDEINTTLGTVTDKASADAAAERLAPVCKYLQNLIREGEKLDQPTPEVASEIETLQPEAARKFGEMIGKLGSLAPDYHGSETLRELFESM